MVNIGEFARLGGVSTRMLRHYDALGVLKPAHVDTYSGRRSYDVAQLPVLNRLVALKGLGFSLDEVGVLLGEGVGPAQLQGMLRLRQAEFERRVRHDRHALDRVTARLRLIEQETQVTTQIETKQVDPLTLATLSATAPDAGRAGLRGSWSGVPFAAELLLVVAWFCGRGVVYARTGSSRFLLLSARLHHPARFRL